MINGLGVVGWGVGGIEAEAVMLGQPIYMLTAGSRRLQTHRASLPKASTATDLVLTVTQMLRQHGVVGKFVEFFGPGLAAMTLADRATSPTWLPNTGRRWASSPSMTRRCATCAAPAAPTHEVDLVERYYKEQGMFRTADSPEPEFSSMLELDLSTVEASLAGPKRPQDRIALTA